MKHMIFYVIGESTRGVTAEEIMGELNHQLPREKERDHKEWQNRFEGR